MSYWNDDQQICVRISPDKKRFIFEVDDSPLIRISIEDAANLADFIMKYIESTKKE